MSMLEVLFVPRLAAGVKWPFIKLWRAILDQRTRVSPEHPWTLEATDIEKVLLGEEFAAFLPGMTEALASVFAKAMCAQKNRYTAKEFKDALLPLLPLQLEAEEC
ncbi:hypothetical protein N7512_000053 [Penicillium capsulatum]|nr:hypothetical protein N7512_000053 [Penicillium capsulatum]